MENQLSVPVVGMPETKEVIDGIMMIACKLAHHLKDGFQLHDILGVMKEFSNDKEFTDTLSRAFQGVSKIPSEISGMGITDGMELTVIVLPWVQKLVNELK